MDILPLPLPLPLDPPLNDDPDQHQYYDYLSLPFSSSIDNSHHSSPGSASATGSQSDESVSAQLRTPSPPGLGVDVDPFALHAFDIHNPGPYGALGGDPLTFDPALGGWSGFPEPDWSKLLQVQGGMNSQGNNNNNNLNHIQPKQEPSNHSPLHYSSYPFHPSLTDFNFQHPQPFPVTTATTTVNDLRYPLSGYPEPPQPLQRRPSATNLPSVPSVPSIPSVASSGSVHTPPTPASVPSATSSVGYGQGYPQPGRQQAEGGAYQGLTYPGVHPIQPPSLPGNTPPRAPGSSPNAAPAVAFTLPPGSMASAPAPTQKAPAKRRLTPHNTIERRYRRNLNSCIQALRDAVPAVAILDRERWGDRWIPDEKGYVDGVRRAGKNSKSVVLEKGVEYIGVLGRRNARLTRERAALQALLCSIPQGQMLYAHWEASFYAMDRHLYGPDELFRVPGGVSLAEAGITLGPGGSIDDVMGDEGDEEEGEEWDEDGDDEEEGRRGTKRQRVSDEAGMVVPPPPPMGAAPADPERRKRGRPRKNTQSSPPNSGMFGSLQQQQAQPQQQPQQPQPQQQQQPNQPSPPGQRLSPQQAQAQLAQAQQMAIHRLQAHQHLQMQQLAYQQQLQQMSAMPPQQFPQAQQYSQGQAQQQQQRQQQQQQQQQPGAQGQGEGAPRYLLAAFLCFSVFRSGSPLFSSPSSRAYTGEETHTGSVISPYHAAAPSSWGSAQWMDVVQVVLMALLVLSLWVGGGWSWLARGKAGAAGARVDDTEARRVQAEKALFARKGAYARVRAVLAYLPSALLPSAPQDRALLALLIPNWPVFGSVARRLWTGAALDVSIDEDEDDTYDDAVLRAALTIELSRARELVRDAAVKSKAAKREGTLFAGLAEYAIRHHVSDIAATRFVSVVRAASRPQGTPESTEGGDVEIADWAERAAVQLGGTAGKLVDLFDDVQSGWEDSADDLDVNSDDAQTLLVALSMLPACSPSASDRKASDAVKMQLRRTLGAKVFDSSTELAEARDSVVDWLGPRRNRR